MLCASTCWFWSVLKQHKDYLVYSTKDAVYKSRVIATENSRITLTGSVYVEVGTSAIVALQHDIFVLRKSGHFKFVPFNSILGISRNVSSMNSYQHWKIGRLLEQLSSISGKQESLKKMDMVTTCSFVRS